MCEIVLSPTRSAKAKTIIKISYVNVITFCKQNEKTQLFFVSENECIPAEGYWAYPRSKTCSRTVALFARVQLRQTRTTLFRFQGAHDLSATTQTGLSTDKEKEDLFRNILMYHCALTWSTPSPN